MPNFGSYRLRKRLYVSDKNNGAGDDISGLILTGGVKVDANQDIPMTFAGTSLDPHSIPDFTFVAPFLTLEYNDPVNGLITQTEQQGLFVIMPPGETHTAADGTGRIEGKDVCWLLKNNTIPTATTFSAGSNITAAIKSVIAGAGLSRQSIPFKGNTFTEDKSYDPGTPRLTIANELCLMVGFYPIYADRLGVPTTTRFRTMQKEEPIHKISSALGDVLNVVTLDPDPEQLCNRASVTKTDAAADPIYYSKDNTRLDSPISIPNMNGVVLGKKLEASNIDTLEEAQALVQKTLEEGASYIERINVDTLPFLTWDVRDVVHLVIFRDDDVEVATGRWWCDQLEISFVPSQRPMTWRLNKLFKFDPEDI